MLEMTEDREIVNILLKKEDNCREIEFVNILLKNRNKNR